MRRQWLHEAETRSLLGAGAVRTRWTSAGDRTLGDAWREVPSKQLLVVGDPAQGKTSGVLLLTLELLAQRSESDPVPVLLPISSWNPAEHLHAWAARRLADDYPALTDRRIYGPDAPLRLVLDRRVVLVLDGLDELPSGLRRSAVEALNYAAAGDYPLIVTCRRADFEQIRSERLPLLPRAMVVAALPVAATTAIDVAARTREQIERIVAKKGYERPRKAPQKPRRSRAALLDLVINELDSSWATEILTGTEEVAREHGMHLVLTAVHTAPTPGKGWLESLTARGTRGVILVLSDLSARQRTELNRLSIPFVIVDALGRQDPTAHSVGATNWHGGYSAVQHLISLGHRRIAVIGGPEQMMCTKARVAGYRDALEVAGIPHDPRLVRYGDFRHEQGYRQTKALLALPNPPTGIFAGSDLQALGAYQALHEHHLRVPDDVSVVGFDDLPFAPWTAPPLTTVRQPLRDMGALATRMLISLIRGEKLTAPRAELATNLVVRGSTAPVRSR